MNSVHLSRKLALEAAERSSDGAGGYVEHWQELGVLWAEIAARTGRERRAGTVPVSLVAYKIVAHGCGRNPDNGFAKVPACFTSKRWPSVIRKGAF